MTSDAVVMTDQGIFDRVSLHLLAQGRPAREGGSCKYRTVDGSKCAIGCLIEDDQYTPGMEFYWIYILAERYSSRMKNILNGTSSRLAFLEKLQIAHDNCDTDKYGQFNRDALLSRLRAVAKVYELSDAVLRD